MPVRAVVVDRDGVLTTLDRTQLVRDVLSRLPLPETEIVARWRACLGSRALRDAGEEQDAIGAFLRGLADELQLGVAARDALIGLDYLGCIRGFDDARDALLEARRRGVRVAVLTNNGVALSPRRPLVAAGLDQLVDAVLSSQMIGAAKPEPLAYRSAAAALGVAPEHCVFFDDTAAWVEGARAVGMSGWHVDRTRSDHDLDAGVIRDLTALPFILDGGRRPLVNHRGDACS